MTKILVVDDERAISRGLSRAILLRRPDYSVLVATSGAEAMGMLEEQHVDMVITDLQMVDGDGFALLAWLIGKRPSVFAFAMSGFCDEDAQARLQALGAIECFAKPLDMEALLKRITESLATSMRGQVNNVGLPSFLQLVELEQKTCTLEVRQQGRVGRLYMRRGELIDAHTDNLRGEAAAYAIVGWLTVDVTIEGSCNTLERTIWKPTHFLLMEAMRMQDEASRAGSSTRVEEASAPVFSLVDERTGEHRMLVSPTVSKRSSVRVPPPPGSLALAVIDVQTGFVIASVAQPQTEVGELARSAHLIACQQSATLAQASSGGERMEELVVMTHSRGELLRPLPGARQLVLLVFDAQETNLVMARLELEQWIADYISADER